MSNTAEAAPGDANQATRDAYALNARVRTIVVETLPTIARQLRMIDFASRSTGSDSMPGNVALAIADMLSTLEAMKARVDGACFDSIPELNGRLPAVPEARA